MKALSVTQPWATLAAIGAKRWETRSWSTAYRGPIAIHAAKGFPKEAHALCFQEPFFSTLAHAGFHADTLPHGAIIAIATLTDVVRITPDNAPPSPEREFGDYTPGRYMWKLENVTPLPTPIPAKGALSLWEWDHPAGVALKRPDIGTTYF